MIRSDNAVQFSKTTALLGAAGKTTIRLLLRQAPSPNIFNSVLLLDRLTLSPSQQTSRPISHTGGSTAGAMLLRLPAHPHTVRRAVDECSFHREESSLDSFLPHVNPDYRSRRG